MAQHKYTLTVTLDGITTFSNLVNGGYSLNAGTLHSGPPGFHDKLQVTLHKSFGDLKSQYYSLMGQYVAIFCLFTYFAYVVADTLSEKLSLVLDFSAPPPGQPSYWIGFQPIVAGEHTLYDLKRAGNDQFANLSYPHPL